MKPEEILILYKEGKLSTAELQEKLRAIKRNSLKSPLSEGQKGLWALEKMSPQMSAYNIPICFRLEQKINLEIFKRACGFLLKQYPILNTVIGEEGGAPYQEIKMPETLDFKEEDISALEPHEVLPYIKKAAKKPFSLKDGPLIRFSVLTRGKEERVLITIHHMIFDGSSSLPFLTTLMHTYRELLQNREPELIYSETSYFDFVAWEQKMMSGEEGKEHFSYWKKQLSGDLPVLEFPTDRPRSPEQSFEGKTYTAFISRDMGEQIKQFALTQHVNLSVVFLGMMKVLLYRYTGQEDIIVGMPVSSRPEECFDPLIGYFINMIPIRSKGIGGQPFYKLLEELQLTLADALDHAMYPFPALVRELNVPRTPTHAPVFQTAFFYQNFVQHAALKKLQEEFTIEFIEEIHQEGEYELTLEVFEKEEGFILNIKYNPDLLDDETISRFTEHFIQMAEGIMKEPALTAEAYSMMSEKEQKAVLVEWNKTEEDYPRDKCMHVLFEEQAQKTPDAIAVACKENLLTYRELDEKSTLLAIHLQEKGVGPDTLVGICVDRSLDMIVGLLGILKAGGAYIPLDPEYPDERLEYMIEDSKITFILTQEALKRKVSRLVGDGVHMTVLDKDWQKIERERGGRSLSQDVRTNHLAYVIYTSGSTGKPKGVMISHQALTNFLISMKKRPGIHSKDKLMAVTTYCFDIAGLELYLPLISGAQCQIADAGVTKDVEKLKEELRRQKPTVMQATPVTWTMLFQSGWKNEENVKILCGGEALTERLKQYFMETESEVWNMFGPTETTIWSTVEPVAKEEPITIGRPIANTQVYILDRHLKPTPIGIPGELCIGGDGLAKGYLNNPGLTQEKFIPNPYSPGTKLYKTGDLARWLSNGKIEFIGRNDHQVKIRGFRIELGEIESRLISHPEVLDSVVVIKEQDGIKKLVAFYVRENGFSGETLSSHVLREHLKARLPHYMIPSLYIELDKIPLTPNGKVNRKELMNRKIQYQKFQETALPQTEIEKKVLKIWKELLEHEDIRMDDGFFEVGGDSFLAVALAERIKESFDLDMNVTVLFKHSNIKDLSKYIAKTKENNTGYPAEANENHRPDTLDNLKTAYSKDDQKETVPDYYEDSMAVIGISCHFPGAKNCLEFWNNLRDGKECIRFFSSEELSALNLPKEIIENANYIPVQATIEDKDLFDPAFFNISPRDAAYMDPQFRLLLLHSWQALEDAGYVSKEIPETGVFMSASNSFYQAFLPDFTVKTPKIIKDPDEYVSWVLAQGGTIPTMISHKLGFKGPSFFVHSNCSSSLVGLYSAYQALKTGEAKYALVGGATVYPSSNVGYIYEAGLNFSSDGHCKTFDASADGMVGGEGVAVIVLKNAIEAVKEGDHIYALLRGIGVNNDGADKVGFYAPSVNGQAQVIRKVLDSTKINPESIGYVEAHGTGTKLGDPIEFAALNEVYTQYTHQKQFCGIGSVKTNIGHTDTAAGLAGCIKVILSLYHNEIPPSVNFKQPNPNIDLKNSPFFVADQLKQLKKSPTPHRAAVSSFGIGGTNAHAVFEQYRGNGRKEPADLKSTGGSGSYIIPLSAKNGERLKVYAQELLHYIKPDTDLAGLAYTLQVGREAMESRVILMVDTIDELKRKLSDFIRGEEEIEGLLKGEVKKTKNPVSIHLEGKNQGEKRWTDNDLEEIAKQWVQGFHMDWNWLYENKKPQRISLPTYPFAGEPYGIPKKSIPQPVKDTKTVWESRGEFVHPLLHQNTSDFFGPRFSSTFTEDVLFITDALLKNQRFFPGTAYLEMARAAVQQAAGMPMTVNSGIRLKNLLWALPAPVCDQPLRINIRLCPQENDEIFYEIYGEPTSCNKETVIYNQGSAVLGELDKVLPIDLNALKKNFDEENILSDQWSGILQSGGIGEIFAGPEYMLAKLSLPDDFNETENSFVLHPILLEMAFWVGACFMHPSGKVEIVLPFALEEVEILHGLTPSVWVFVRFSEGSRASDSESKLDMEFYDDDGKVHIRIKGISIKVIKDEVKSTKAPPETGTVLLEPCWKEKSVSPGAVLPYEGARLIVFCEVNDVSLEYAKTHMNGTECLMLQSGQSGIAERFQEYTIDLFEKIQEILKNKPQNSVLIQVVTVRQEEQQLLAGLSGLLKTIPLENPKVLGQLIEIEPGKGRDEIVDIVNRSAQSSTDNWVRYQKGIPYLGQWEEIEVLKEELPWKDHGVYLITGGAGGLGLIFAGEITRRVKGATLILTGRSDLDADKKARMKELENSGARVQYRQVDVTKMDPVQALIQEIRDEFGGLNGIIHSAGIIRDHFILKKAPQEFLEVLEPKVKGVVNLDEASKDLSLDFFILFSSIAGTLGNQGQGDYSAANAFMDAFAGYRNTLVAAKERTGRTLSINWPLWQEGGMHVDNETQKIMRQELGIAALETKAGIKALYQCLGSKKGQVMVLSGELAKIRKQLFGHVPVILQETAELRASDVEPKMLQEKTLYQLKQLMGSVIRMDPARIDAEEPMENYGIDSILVVQFNQKLSEVFGELSKTLFFEYENLRELAEYFVREHSEACIKWTYGGPGVLEKPKAPAEALTFYSELSESDSKALQQKTLYQLKQLMGNVIKMDPARIDEEEAMENYGIDSILVVQFNQKLSEVFGELSKTLFFEYENLRELAEYFMREHPEACAMWTGAEEKTSTLEKSNTALNILVPEGEFPVLTSKKREGKWKPYLQAKELGDVREPIAIIGISGRYPKARTLEEYWENLKAGKDCITEIPKDRWSLDEFYHPDHQEAVLKGKSYSKWGGFIEGVQEFDPLFFNISPRDAANMDPQERLFMESCWEVLEDAGYTREKLAVDYNRKVGVFAGITQTGFALYSLDLWKQGERVYPYTSFSSVANRASYLLNLQGPSMPVDTMCSSSLTAIHEACEHIYRQECEMAIAGGVNLYLHPSSYIGLSVKQMLSKNNKCAAFGQGGDGFVPGEGVGTVLLKPLSRAEKDGDHIYAVILASSVNHSGKTNGYLVPNPNAQTDLILENLKKAGIDPRTISYVESAANGSDLGDAIELNALIKAFAQKTKDKHFCAVGSVKPNIGHLEAASGISQLTKVILQLKHKMLVPSIHAEPLNPNLSFENTPFYLQRELQEWKRTKLKLHEREQEFPRRATVSSFGAGGSNAHLVIEEYIPTSTKEVNTLPKDSREVVVLSAKKPQRLHAAVRQMLDFIENREISLADLAYTLQVGREAMVCRLAVVVSSKEELVDSLKKYLGLVQAESEEKLFIPIFQGNLGEEHTGFKDLLSGNEGETLLHSLIEGKYLEKLALCWVQGGKIPWESLHKGKEVRRISLPTYPFEKQRIWFNLKKEPAQASEPSFENRIDLDSKEKTHTLNTHKDYNKLAQGLYEIFNQYRNEKENRTLLNQRLENLLSIQLDKEDEGIRESIDKVTEGIACSLVSLEEAVDHILEHLQKQRSLKINIFLKEIMCGLLDLRMEDLRMKLPLYEYGMDSVVFMDLYRRLKEYFNFLDVTKVKQSITLHDVVLQIEEQADDQMLDAVSIKRDGRGHRSGQSTVLTGNKEEILNIILDEKEIGEQREWILKKLAAFSEAHLNERKLLKTDAPVPHFQVMDVMLDERNCIWMFFKTKVVGEQAVADITHLQDFIQKNMDMEKVPILYLAHYGPHFLLGGDRLFFAESNRNPEEQDKFHEWVERFKWMFNANPPEDFPLRIAVCAGTAQGGGFEFLISSDFQFVLPQVKLGVPEIKSNLYAGMGGLSYLASQVGLARTKLFNLTGGLIFGHQAYEMGLISHLSLNPFYDAYRFYESIPNIKIAKHLNHRLNQQFSHLRNKDLDDWVEITKANVKEAYQHILDDYKMFDSSK
ncbi:MAG: amino acid adenylation domain-containing protein [Clostridia bacterium]|nr:amino acid adenylation domain-containing protein [Clostridia bacterium]